MSGLRIRSRGKVNAYEMDPNPRAPSSSLMSRSLCAIIVAVIAGVVIFTGLFLGLYDEGKGGGLGSECNLSYKDFDVLRAEYLDCKERYGNSSRKEMMDGANIVPGNEEPMKMPKYLCAETYWTATHCTRDHIHFNDTVWDKMYVAMAYLSVDEGNKSNAKSAFKNDDFPILDNHCNLSAAAIKYDKVENCLGEVDGQDCDVVVEEAELCKEIRSDNPGCDFVKSDLQDYEFVFKVGEILDNHTCWEAVVEAGCLDVDLCHHMRPAPPAPVSSGASSIHSGYRIWNTNNNCRNCTGMSKFFCDAWQDYKVVFRSSFIFILAVTMSIAFIAGWGFIVNGIAELIACCFGCTGGSGGDKKKKDSVKLKKDSPI